MRILVALLAFLPSVAQAKAYIATRGEMVERAAAIAIVEIKSTEDVEVKGGHWTYAERADARVDEVIAGDLPSRAIWLHGQESFICARVDWRPGRFLVFLAQDGDLWVGSNWHLSALPIEDGIVQWPDADSRTPKSVPLEDALAEIRAARR